MKKNDILTEQNSILREKSSLIPLNDIPAQDTRALIKKGGFINKATFFIYSPTHELGNSEKITNLHL